MKLPVTACLILTLCVSALGAPSGNSAPPAPRHFFDAARELRRLQLGPQVGIMKVLGPERQGVLFNRGLDDYHLAPLDQPARDAIFAALGLAPGQVRPLAHEIVSNFAQLPKTEAVAFLGVVASDPALDAYTFDRIEKFLVRTLQSETNVSVRRHALLALALQPRVSAATTESVLCLFERSDNLWETFPVQQYFAYHAAQLRRQPNFPELRQRLAAVNSLYTPGILNSLEP